MSLVDITQQATVVEVGPGVTVLEYTDTGVTALADARHALVEFIGAYLDPGPGLKDAGWLRGFVPINIDWPGLPPTSEEMDPLNDYFAMWDESQGIHVKIPAGDLMGGGGGGVEFATREETDEGILLDKALNPDVGAYAYDRFRHAGQHTAGKATTPITLVPDTGAVTIDCLLSNVFELRMDQNVHFNNPINPLLGQTVNILIRQDMTGGRTATFGSQWTFANKTNPSLTSAPGAVDLLSCQWDFTANKMRASFLPNFGSGFGAPPTAADLTFTNIGGGNEVVKEVVDTDVRFRTLLGGGDIDVTTEGDNILISYTAPALATPTFQTLPDVTIPENILAGEFLRWDGEKVVQTIVPIPDTESQTYLTQNDETDSLPNSRQMLAGENISLDYSVPGQLTISALGMDGAWTGNDGCMISRNTDLSITGPGYGALVFTTEERDDHGYWDPATPDRFTIPADGDGWYLVSCYLYWNSTSTGHGVFINKNTTVAANEIASNYSSAAGTSIRNQAAALHYFVAGDVVILRGYAQATSSILGSTAPMRASIHRIGSGPPGPRGEVGPPGPAEDDGTFIRRLVDDTVLGNLTFEHIAPRTIFKELGQPLDHKRWDILVDNGEYALRAISDSEGSPPVPGTYLTNARAEAMTGWTTLTGTPGVVVNRCPPVLFGTGTNGFWGGTSASSSMRQRIDLSAFPSNISLSGIDAGTVDVTMDWWGGSWIQSPYDKPRIILRYRDAALTDIGNSDTGERSVAAGGLFGSYYWQHYTDVFTIPPLTRYIDVELMMIRHAGSNNDATITDVVLSFSSTFLTADNVYKVTREGARAINMDVQTDTFTHNGLAVSVAGHGHAEFAKTYGAQWRTSDGSALLTSNCQIVYVSVPAACSINEVVVLTEGGVGSCVIDIWKDTYANYPPLVADAITGLTKPTILFDTKTRDEELNGWIHDIDAGDILAFKVNSTSVFTSIQIQLKVL